MRAAAVRAPVSSPPVAFMSAIIDGDPAVLRDPDGGPGSRWEGALRAAAAGSTAASAQADLALLALSAVLAHRRQPLAPLMLRWRESRGRQRSLALRELLQTQELLLKLEQQLLLPGLGEAAPLRAAALRDAERELELLRDMTLLVRRNTASRREVALEVLVDLQQLHFQRIDGLLVQADVDASPRPDWAALHDRVQTQLQRWRVSAPPDGDAGAGANAANHPRQDV